jgi:flagellar FliJ protein
MHILHTLKDRDQRLRDEALMACRDASRQLDTARAQVEALVNYRSEYRARWAGEFSRAAPIEIVRCYQGFVSRLDQAIISQENTVQHAEAGLLRAQAKLKQRELKLATVGRIIIRREQTAAQHARRDEQRRSDEGSQRLAWAAREAQAA